MPTQSNVEIVDQVVVIGEYSDSVEGERKPHRMDEMGHDVDVHESRKKNYNKLD